MCLFEVEFTNENIKNFIDLNSHPVVYPTRNPRVTAFFILFISTMIICIITGVNG